MSTVAVGNNATISHIQTAGELKIAFSLFNTRKNTRETKVPIAVPATAICTALVRTLKTIRQR